jgi:hypothetical protein
MDFVYLDEAGNTGTDLNNQDQPIHYISGIIIPEERMQIIERKIRSLLPNFAPYSQNFDFEFHGTDMISGKKHFKTFNIKQRLNAFRALLAIFENENLSFFCQGINKLKHKEKYQTPYHPHNVAFMYLIEKIDIYLDSKKHLGFVVMDKCKDVEQNIINDFDGYREKGTPFGFKREIKNFVDNVAYVDSYNSYLLQLADVIGYIATSSYTHEFKGKKNGYVRSEIDQMSLIIRKKSVYFDIEPK